jgi:hypothetical protein
VPARAVRPVTSRTCVVCGVPVMSDPTRGVHGGCAPMLGVAADRVAALKAKVRASLDAKAAERARRVVVTPRYDDVYFKGTAWLDSLANDDEPTR